MYAASSQDNNNFSQDSSSTARTHSLQDSPEIDGYRYLTKKQRGHRYISPLQYPKSPYFLIPRDHSRALIVSNKLTSESNYIT